VGPFGGPCQTRQDHLEALGHAARALGPLRTLHHFLLFFSLLVWRLAGLYPPCSHPPESIWCPGEKGEGEPTHSRKAVAEVVSESVGANQIRFYVCRSCFWVLSLSIAPRRNYTPTGQNFRSSQGGVLFGFADRLASGCQGGIPSGFETRAAGTWPGQPDVSVSFLESTQSTGGKEVVGL